MNSGWIKIHREITDHWIFQDDKYFKWWITILLNVNHEIKKFPVNGELVTCNPGESFRSIDEWTGLLNCHKKTLYKFFDLLENDSMIARKTLGKGNRRKHLLTVVNWSKFQEKETEKYTESAPEKYTESVPLTRMKRMKRNIEGEKSSKFSPPSLFEIQNYFTLKIQEKRIPINPKIESEKFESFYSSKNWYVGKNKMTDWKKAVSGWIARLDKTNGSTSTKKILQPATNLEDE